MAYLMMELWYLLLLGLLLGCAIGWQWLKPATS